MEVEMDRKIERHDSSVRESKYQKDLLNKE